jgi:hypothetical protein
MSGKTALSAVATTILALLIVSNGALSAKDEKSEETIRLKPETFTGLSFRGIGPGCLSPRGCCTT